MGISQIVRDERELKKLLRSSTGLKVFEARYVGCYNGFISLSDEAILDKAHITFYRGSGIVLMEEYTKYVFIPLLLGTGQMYHTSSLSCVR